MRPQTVHVSATPGTLGAGADRRRLRRAGDPPDRPHRSAGRDPPGAQPGRRSARRGQGGRAKRGYRTLVTTLTKRMAEDLTEYLHENGVRVRYMHSDIDTIERIEIIRDLRLGAFDVLVGINLLREGLDIPECALVAILDADKEGFLRSETSLVQTIGRAARNVDGKVILYADAITGSMSGRSRRPTAAARSRRPTTRPTASPRPRSAAASRTFSARSTRPTTSPSTSASPTAPPSATICKATDRRSREADEGGGRQPRIRGGGAPARRDQAPADGRAGGRRRPAGAAGRRSRRRPAPTPASARSAAPRTCPRHGRASRPTKTWARTTGAAARRGRRAGQGGGGEGGGELDFQPWRRDGRIYQSCSCHRNTPALEKAPAIWFMPCGLRIDFSVGVPHR